MANRVLILSSDEDAHAKNVRRCLTEIGAKSVCWKFDSFLQSSLLSFQISGDTDRFKIMFDGKLLDMRSFDAIWFRRPGYPVAKDFFHPWVGN